jgi:tryptophan halogenase
MNKINSICIVGGGSAGWMTASTLIKFFPDKKITLIESDSVGRIGVGESTLPTLMAWCNALGINHHDFMRDTDASYKLSISFKNFYKNNGSSFHYPFGNPYKTNSFLGNGNDWHVSKILDESLPIKNYTESFFPQMNLINENKISSKEVDGFSLKKDSALHFNAIKFADWLRDNYAVPRGVSHVIANIDKVNTDVNGITKLDLNSGQSMEFDLYFDCSGFKSMLLGEALDERFIDYSDRLPVNRSWAVQIPYENIKKELKTFTESTALGYGWVWNAPLYSRIGTGYVYSDKFTTPEDALKEFKEYLIKEKGESRINDSLKFNDVKFKTGTYENTWVKNVIAIGLSAAFVEPLESNGLFFIHENLLKVVQVLSKEKVNSFDVASYNLITKKSYDSFANFVRMHYYLSSREDTEFWKFMTNLEFNSNDMSPNNEIFENTLNMHSSQSWDMSGISGSHAILVGNNTLPISMPYIHMLDHYAGIDAKELSFNFLSKSAISIKGWKSFFSDAENHYLYLKNNFHEGEKQND